MDEQRNGASRRRRCCVVVDWPCLSGKAPHEVESFSISNHEMSVQ